MAEASDRKAKSNDVQEDTFLRFCQFAYTGNYTTPIFTHRPDVELPLATSQDSATTDRDDNIPPAPKPESEPESGVADSWGDSSPKNGKNQKNRHRVTSCGIIQIQSSMM